MHRAPPFISIPGASMNRTAWCAEFWEPESLPSVRCGDQPRQHMRREFINTDFPETDLPIAPPIPHFQDSRTGEQFYHGIRERPGCYHGFGNTQTSRQKPWQGIFVTQ